VVHADRRRPAFSTVDLSRPIACVSVIGTPNMHGPARAGACGRDATMRGLRGETVRKRRGDIVVRRHCGDRFALFLRGVAERRVVQQALGEHLRVGGCALNGFNAKAETRSFHDARVHVVVRAKDLVTGMQLVECGGSAILSD
jgi:hypothetical protein